LAFDDFRTQFDKFIKRKRKKYIFEVKQFQLEYSIVPDWAHSNLIFAFGGNLFDHWEYILINL
jgi:hypothetical protein